MMSRLLPIATLAVIVAASTPVMANPIYLSCIFMIDGKAERIQFTADEAAGSVSILIPSSGHSRTVNGAFTADRVVIDERQVRWEISRLDLTVTRNIKMIDSTKRGQCEIQTTPQRAF